MASSMEKVKLPLAFHVQLAISGRFLSSLVHCFCTADFHHVMAEPSAPACAVGGEGGAAEQSPRPAGKSKGRPKAGTRPKVDIDDEITEANRLAEVTKRMMQAAKAAQKNFKRQKQRLVRKAGKLSASDLERIAVLKRCGLFVDQTDAESTASGSGSASASSASSGSPATGPASMSNKLASVVGKVNGATELLTSMQGAIGTDTAPDNPGNSSGAVRAAHGSLANVPRGRRLSQAVSPGHVVSSQALPAGCVPDLTSTAPDDSQVAAEEDDEAM